MSFTGIENRKRSKKNKVIEWGGVGVDRKLKSLCVSLWKTYRMEIDGIGVTSCIEEEKLRT